MNQPYDRHDWMPAGQPRPVPDQHAIPNSGIALWSNPRYPTCMPKQNHKKKPPESADWWFVYIVQCADGTLYTGTTKDMARRLKQHNDGTASRYTRCRLPVQLVYRELHSSQSAALKREAAIKAMDRATKLEMVRMVAPLGETLIARAC